jgi:hypothetical protein
MNNNDQCVTLSGGFDLELGIGWIGEITDLDFFDLWH